MSLRTRSLGSSLGSWLLIGTVGSFSLQTHAAAPPSKPALEARVAALESQVAALIVTVQGLQRTVEDQTAQVESLQSLLQHFTRVDNDVFITGANLHIRNGTGQTWGESEYQPTANGLGNLVVGYNEPWGGDTRAGSHNVVIGPYHSYASVGGIVAGYFNQAMGPYSCISGGAANIALGDFCSVSGGNGNTADGEYSSISGGVGNFTSERFSSVSGGHGNQAIERASSVSGGYGNTAAGMDSSISGGTENTVSGPYGSISGGYQRSVGTYYDWAAGGLFQDE